MQLWDTHMHSHCSHDGSRTVVDMAQAAVQNGLSGICITDHCDIEFCESVDLEKNASESFAETKEAARAYRDHLTVLCGIEIGEALFFPEAAEKMQKLLSYDVILGSVHAVRFPDLTLPYSKIDFSAMRSESIELYLDRYFYDVSEMIDRFDFDVLSHLTCPLRYIVGKYGIETDMAPYHERIDSILKKIIKRSIALEINTSSLGSQYDELLPSQDIIRRYFDFGGRLITLASDAHVTQRVGHGFNKAVGVLRSIGFDTAYYYQNRTARPYRIV